MPRSCTEPSAENKDKPNYELVYTILRRRAGAPDKIAALEAAYRSTGKTSVKDDIAKYMLGRAPYAEAVYRGDALAVAGMDVEDVRTTMAHGSS